MHVMSVTQLFTISIMPTTFRTPANTSHESFFTTTAAKWLSAIATIVCGVLLYITFVQAPTLEDVLKVTLLTVPASIFMLYRSFVAQV